MNANVIPLMRKTLRGGQNDSKIINPVRKRYGIVRNLHMCTMMQNHCIMCTHGIRKMEKIQGAQKKKKQNDCHGHKYHPLDEKNRPGGQNPPPTLEKSIGLGLTCTCVL